MAFLGSGSFGASFLQPPSSIIGELYNKSSWTDVSDFTATGFTPSVSGGYIQISGTNTGWTKNLVFSNSALKMNADENQTLSITYKIVTLGAGIAIGKKGGLTGNTVFFYDQNDEVDFFENTTARYTTNSCGLNAAANDIIRLTFQQVKNTVNLTVENLTKSITFKRSYTSNLRTSWNFLCPSVSEPVIWLFGGSYEIQKIILSSNSLKSPTVVSIGDSKTHGFAAEGAGGRWGEFFGAASVAIFGGSGDRTAECLQGVPYITSWMKPQYAVLAIGSNDIRGGTSSGTWQANYANIVSQLQNAGITVVHLLPLPENGLDQSGLKSWIQSTYASGKLVDPSVGWANAVHLSTDNVHPSYAGHQFAAQKIIDSGYIPNLSSQSGIAANSLLAISFARVIRSGYSGNAMKVRRSSDNATQVIGYINGELDTASLLSFVGSNSGFIEGFWEQSVNNFYFEQLTTGNQARIVNAGTLDMQGGKASPYFDGGDSYLLNYNSNNSLTFNNTTLCSVVSVANVSADRVLLSGNTNGQFQYRIQSSTGKQDFLKNGITDLGASTSGLSNNTLTVISARISPSAGTISYRKNGIADGTSTFTGFTWGAAAVYFGASGGGGSAGAWIGNISEVLLFPDSYSDNNTHTVELNQGGYFGVSVS